MTDTTLLPCAHCGIELDAVRTPVGDGYWVHPLTEASGVNCPLDDHFINFNDAAGIAAWNRRDQWRTDAKKHAGYTTNEAVDKALEENDLEWLRAWWYGETDTPPAPVSGGNK